MLTIQDTWWLEESSGWGSRSRRWTTESLRTWCPGICFGFSAPGNYRARLQAQICVFEQRCKRLQWTSQYWWSCKTAEHWQGFGYHRSRLLWRVHSSGTGSELREFTDYFVWLFELVAFWSREVSNFCANKTVRSYSTRISRYDILLFSDYFSVLILWACVLYI